jgi:hypothetical protein
MSEKWRETYDDWKLGNPHEVNEPGETVRDLILALRAPNVTPEFTAIHERIKAAHASHTLHDELLNECTDPECIVCGAILCPHGEPLHFHHDGCPACDGGCV